VLRTPSTTSKSTGTVQVVEVLRSTCTSTCTTREITGTWYFLLRVQVLVQSTRLRVLNYMVRVPGTLLPVVVV
jgi:hypothetical protein